MVRTGAHDETTGLIGAACLMLGAAAMAVPFSRTAAVALAGLGGLAAAAVVRDSLPQLFLTGMGILLAGYAFFSRTFAYFGVGPLFVGELCLLLGLLALVFAREFRRLVDSPLKLLLILYIAWCTVRTIPYVGIYGIDAIRDAVIGLYALFALLIAALLRDPATVRTAAVRYARCVPWFLAWVIAAFAITRAWYGAVPLLPLIGVEAVTFKPGDAAVHVGAVAVFALLGLHRDSAPSARRMAVSLALWIVACGVSAALSRGALLSLASAVGVTVVVWPMRVGLRVVPVVAAAVGLLLALALLAPVDVADDQDRRMVSPSQVVVNVRSIIGADATRNLEGTREWRLNWWQDIIRYTFRGEFFSGKGFGVNLANDDGYQVEEDEGLRSPHSIHLTVLARAGVPGLVIWLAINLGYLVLMLITVQQAAAARQTWWAAIATWLLAYWAALLVNASFDVFIEGPQGGIWFWSVIGGGMAAARLSRRERRHRAHPVRPALEASGRPSART